jgi:hypothetical protein
VTHARCDANDAGSVVLSDAPVGRDVAAVVKMPTLVNGVVQVSFMVRRVGGRCSAKAPAFTRACAQRSRLSRDIAELVMNAPSGGTADSGIGRYEFRHIALGPTDMAPWNLCSFKRSASDDHARMFRAEVVEGARRRDAADFNSRLLGDSSFTNPLALRAMLTSWNLEQNASLRADVVGCVAVPRPAPRTCCALLCGAVHSP